MANNKSSNIDYTGLVHRYIGSSYDVVKEVHDHLPHLHAIYENLELERGFTGYEGAYATLVFKISPQAPQVPTDGTYDGDLDTEEAPSGWSIDPLAPVEGASVWVTKRVYHRTADGWVGTDWTDPVVFTTYSKTPVFGEDYFTKDGAFKSFIYHNSETKPTKPTGGSFNGTTEIPPTDWTDDPVDITGDEITWVSTQLYTHDGENWVGSGWSEPARFVEVRKGDQGEVPVRGVDYFDGNFYSFIYRNQATEPVDGELPVGGSFDGTSETPPSGWTDDPYLPEGDEKTWVCKGIYIQGKDGWSVPNWSAPSLWYQQGDKPVEGIDYYSKNGDFHSFIFRNDSAQPQDPVGGSYTVEGETFPDGWTDDLEAVTGNEKTWISKTVYKHDPTNNTWTKTGWSTPVVFNAKGEQGDKPVYLEDYITKNGNYVSFVYALTDDIDTVPDAPVGGGYQTNGTETLPTPAGLWEDDPVIPVGDQVVWISTTVYHHDEVNDTWANTGWSAPAPFYVKGADGIPAKSAVQLTIFRRSSTPITTSPSGGDYNFDNKVLTPPTGWSAEIPSGTSPVYGSLGIAYAAVGDTGVDNDIPWGQPEIAFRDGSGASAISVFQATIFQRSETPLAAPADDSATFDFGANTFTVLPTGWTQEIPQGSGPLYATNAVFSVIGDTGSDSTQTWTTPAIVVTNGNDGSPLVWVGTYATAPANPEINWAYRNSTDGISYVWDGAVWQVSNKDGENGDTIYTEYQHSVDGVTLWHSDFETGDYYRRQRTVTNGVAGNWSAVALIRQDGVDGTNGIDGRDGIDAYMHIAYADDINGTGLSQDPTGKYYIGTYSDGLVTDSNDPADYAWSKYTPEKGVEYDDGNDGTNAYLHIAYADDINGDGFSQDPTGKYFIGTYTDEIEIDSPDPTDYVWSKYVPEKGVEYDDGIDGKDGSFHTYVFITHATQPEVPSGGTYNGSVETYPSSAEGTWTDDPYFTEGKITWVSHNRYIHDGTNWNQVGTWSSPSEYSKQGANGSDGASIVHQGTLTTPPNSPEVGWTYKDSDDGIVYIYTGASWEVMVVDGIDGSTGNSIFVRYHDNAVNTAPTPPTNASGTNNGWTEDPTAESNWMIQMVALNISSGTWGNPILMTGADGSDGYSIFTYNVYKRSSTPITTAPTGGAYDFTNNQITPPTNWSADIPAGSDIVYAARATANTQGATGLDTTIVYADPVVWVQDGVNGIDGERGSRHFYIDGTVWNNVNAVNAILSAEGEIVNRDTVTISNDVSGFSKTKYWTGGFQTDNTDPNHWTTVAQVIDGNLIVHGTIGTNQLEANSVVASKINVGTLSAISADIGAITAGSLSAVDIFAANITGTSTITGGTITGSQIYSGLFSTGDNADDAGARTEIKADAIEPFSIYGTPIDGVAPELLAVRKNSSSGLLELNISGGLAAGSITTADHYTEAGITSLRGRLGVTEPADPTGGTIIYENSNRAMFGQFGVEKASTITGSIDLGTNDVTVTFKGSTSMTYNETTSDATDQNPNRDDTRLIVKIETSFDNGVTWDAFYSTSYTHDPESTFIDTGGEVPNRYMWSTGITVDITQTFDVSFHEGKNFRVRAVCELDAAHTQFRAALINNNTISSFVATAAVTGSVGAHTHSATDIVSGFLNDARLSANVPRKNTDNVWTGNNDFTFSNVIHDIKRTDPLASTTGSVRNIAKVGATSNPAGGNTYSMMHKLIRASTGTTWATARYRLQSMVDSTYGSYIDFSDNRVAIGARWGTTHDTSFNDVMVFTNTGITANQSLIISTTTPTITLKETDNSGSTWSLHKNGITSYYYSSDASGAGDGIHVFAGRTYTADGDLRVVKGGTQYKVYHRGDKPTLADIGALASDGTAVNADKLDNIDSGGFLRSNTSDSFSNTLTYTGSGTAFQFKDSNSGIKRINNGEGIAMFADDGLLIFSGDAEDNYITGAALDGTNTNESLHLVSDANIYISPNQQNGYNTTNRLIIPSSGNLTFNGNTVWHAGNDGSGSGLDADLLRGYGPTTADTANTIALRTSSGDIHARLFRGSYASQTSISGAIAFRVNASNDNYLRYCSSPSAVRTWLGAAASSHNHSAANITSGTLSQSRQAENSSPYRAKYLGTDKLNDKKNELDTGFYYQTSNANATTAGDYPEATAGSLLIQRSAKSGDYGATQMYITYNDGDLYTRAAYGSWSAWRKFINDGNYTSYTVTKTGSGASGTWGISITGNAATATNASTLGGASANTGVSNNTIVKRTSSGYIYANYFNTNPNDVTSGVTKVLVETGNDGFMRHGTAGAIASFISGQTMSIGGNAATATWADTVDVNGGNTSSSWYDVVWHSGDVLYSTQASKAIEIQSSTGSLRAYGNIQRGSWGNSNTQIVRSTSDTTWGSKNTACFSHAIANSSNAHWLLASYQNGTSSTMRFGIQVLTSGNGQARFYNDEAGHYVQFSRGAITATKTITGTDCIATSDVRVKFNRKVIQNASWRRSQLTGETFNRSDMDGRRHAGVIAQDVEKVLPEAIFKTDDKELGQKLNVSTSCMIGLLVQSGNEDRRLLDEANKRIDKLEAMMEQLLNG